jgi:hypothetical protein
MKVEKITSSIIAVILFLAVYGCSKPSELPIETTTDTSFTTTVSEITVFDSTTMTSIVEIADNPDTVIIGGIEFDIETTTEINLDNTQGTYDYKESQKLNDDDIKDIIYLKNLRTLSIVNNNITDISFVQNLEKLEELNIANNPVIKLYVTNNLKKINLQNTDINDISPLSDCRFIEYISINYNDIDDLNPIFEQTRLKYLCLYGEALQDEYLPKISNLTNLRELVIFKENTEFDCNVVSKLKYLEKLSIFRTNSINVDSLSNLTNLKELSLELYPEDGDVSFLKNMNSLEVLSLTNVTDGKYIFSIETLEELYLDYGSLSFDGIDQMPNLEVLSLRYIYLTDSKDYEDIYKIKNLREFIRFSYYDGSLSENNAVSDTVYYD